ncbi:hypothetical protein M0Q97_07835 [Candidatus Dojkabacteria bacterium]|jgi:hypothetical protein|nr:hypothetical protein [Candidatus Dojkabacteria bacterium]
MKISFAHNVQNRHETLRKTIEMELSLYPNSNVCVAYNDNSFNLNYFNDLKNIKFIKYVGEGHKIGCVNGCIVSIKESLNDDSDIIVFSHDDVSINPEYITTFNINLLNILTNKFDIICRNPHSYGNNYYMMEGFFLRKKIAETIFENINIIKDINNLPKDIKSSPSPEVWLFNILNYKNFNINCINYLHSTDGYNEVLGKNLGFYHKNAGIRGWKN